jgi:hypothetical protein
VSDICVDVRIELKIITNRNSRLKLVWLSDTYFDDNVCRRIRRIYCKYLLLNSQISQQQAQIESIGIESSSWTEIKQRSLFYRQVWTTNKNQTDLLLISIVQFVSTIECISSIVLRQTWQISHHVTISINKPIAIHHTDKKWDHPVIVSWRRHHLTFVTCSVIWWNRIHTHYLFRRFTEMSTFCYHGQRTNFISFNLL